METIYFPCDPATQSDPSDLAWDATIIPPATIIITVRETHLVWQQTGASYKRLTLPAQVSSDSYQILAGNLFSAFPDVSGTQCIFQYRLFIW